MKVVNVKIADLKPYEKNAKKHPENQIELLKKNIEKFGFTSDEWRFCKENTNYVVTLTGVVFSICREQKSKSGRIYKVYKSNLLSGSIDRYGYRTIRMVVADRKKHVKVHRLVANAFIKNEEMKEEVNHKDGNKLNNCIENLEWVTRRENNRHAIDIGLLTFTKGDAHWRTIILKADYVTIFMLNRYCNLIRKELARMRNVSRQTIDNIINIVKKVLFKINNNQIYANH